MQTILPPKVTIYFLVYLTAPSQLRGYIAPKRKMTVNEFGIVRKRPWPIRVLSYRLHNSRLPAHLPQYEARLLTIEPQRLMNILLQTILLQRFEPPNMTTRERTFNT